MADGKRSAGDIPEEELPNANTSAIRGKLDLVYVFVLFNDHLN